MKTLSLAGRSHYGSSGSVDWIRYTPLLLIAIAASALGAALLYLLLTWGLYFIIIVPIIVGLGVAALVNFAVGRGHCRSRFVGALSGLICGVVLYLGYYYVGMVAALGFGGAAQIEFLPDYIYFRLNTDESREAHSPKREDEGHKPRAGRFYLNLFAFGVELLGVLALTTAAGFRRTGRPYCEGCKRWMERELTAFAPDKAPAIIQALRDGAAPALAALCLEAPYPSVPNTALAVEFCPSVKEGGWRSCPVFASLKSITANAQGATFDAFQSAKGNLLVRAVQLNDDEVLALLPRFRMFESTTGKTTAGALQQLRVTPPPPPSQAPAVASITPVEPAFAGRVMTRSTKLKMTAFSALALVLLFGGIGLMAWGGVTAFPDKKDGAGEVSAGRKALGVSLLTAGGVLFVGALGFVLFDVSFLGHRYLKRVFHRELALRPSRLVEPDDPQALFVEVVPKTNWGKLQLDNAADVGLLRVDDGNREVLFEGDRERYRIPAAAIISCDIEFFVEAEGAHGATQLFYVVLRAHHPTAFWEAPIRERGNLGLFKTGRRKKQALALQSAIRRMATPTS
jgi:hypothetical protein